MLGNGLWYWQTKRYRKIHTEKAHN